MIYLFTAMHKYTIGATHRSNWCCWSIARTLPTSRSPVDFKGRAASLVTQEAVAGGALTYSVTNSAREASRVGNLVASVTIIMKGTGVATAEDVLATEIRQQQA